VIRQLIVIARICCDVENNADHQALPPGATSERGVRIKARLLDGGVNCIWSAAVDIHVRDMLPGALGAQAIVL
jgi:hypothetical protein